MASLSPKDTADLMMKALAEAFPRSVFRMETRVFSLGAKAVLSWIDGPSVSRVRDIVEPLSGSTLVMGTHRPQEHLLDGVRTMMGIDLVDFRRDLSENARLAPLRDITPQESPTAKRITPIPY